MSRMERVTRFGRMLPAISFIRIIVGRILRIGLRVGSLTLRASMGQVSAGILIRRKCISDLCVL